MSKVTLQFVLANAFSSRLIAWWGQGYGGYSHVDAVLPTGELLGARSDAVGGKPQGVQIRPADYEKWNRVCRMSLACTDKQANAWDAFLRAHVNDDYDETDILGLIIGKPVMSAGHWICSALQCAALEAAGLMPKLLIEPQQVSPNTLRVAFSAIGAVIDT